FNNFVTVSETGFGISFLKAEDGMELLAAPIGLVAISDTSDTWAHGINQFRQEIGRPTLVSSAVVENGPVTRVTRHEPAGKNQRLFSTSRSSPAWTLSNYALLSTGASTSKSSSSRSPQHLPIHASSPRSPARCSNAA